MPDRLIHPRRRSLLRRLAALVTLAVAALTLPMVGASGASSTETVISITTGPTSMQYLQQSNFTVTAKFASGGNVPNGAKVRIYDVTDAGNPVMISVIHNDISNGSAVLNVQNTTVGTRTIEARLIAGSGYDAASSSARELTVTKSVTEIEISATPTPRPTAGKNTTLTASVYSPATYMSVPNGSGTVQFSINGTPVGGPLTVSSNTSITSPSFTAGDNTVSATFTATNTNYADKTKELPIAIEATASTVSNVVVDPSDSAPGQALTVTADIGPPLDIGGPTSEAELVVGDETIATASTSGGTVTFSDVGPLGEGENTLEVRYPGDAYRSSSSASVTHTVTKWASGTDLTITPSTGVIGSDVELEATVSTTGDAPAPTGSVEFHLDDADGPSIGSAVLDDDGIATFAVDSLDELSPGDHLIVAVYSGTSEIASSSAGETLSLSRGDAVVTADDDAYEATISDQVGGTVEVTSNVTGYVPTGAVEVRLDDDLVATATLVDGAGSFSFDSTGLTAGEHELVFAYSGDVNLNAAVSDPIPLTIDEPRGPITTEVELDLPATAEAGQTIEAIASVTGGIDGDPDPTGTITFQLDDTDGPVIATVDLHDGEAAMQTSDLAAGTRTIVASYSGDDVFEPSVSDPESVEIRQIRAAVAVWVTPTPVVVGAPSTLHATVTTLTSVSSAPTVQRLGTFSQRSALPLLAGPSPLATRASAAATSAATGIVDFSVNGIVVGSAELQNGTATLPYVFSSTGAVRVSASYRGSTNVEAISDAAPTAIEVAPAQGTNAGTPNSPVSTPRGASGGSAEGSSAAPAAATGTTGNGSGRSSSAAAPQGTTSTALAVTGTSAIAIAFLGAALTLAGLATASTRRRLESGRSLQR